MTGYASRPHVNEHDRIQRDLVRKFKEYSKRHLGGVSWPEDKRHEQAYRDESVLKSEKTISGDLPSGKSYCRMDVFLAIGNTEYAFEIKTSASDAMNWPEQERDYGSQGYAPVIVTTPDVVVDLAPGHRLVTDSHHVFAADHSLYFVGNAFPKSLREHFTPGRPLDPLRDRCPECGFKLQYIEFTGEVNHRCKACGWRDSD